MLQVGLRGAKALSTLGKALFKTPLRAALTAGTAGLYVGGNNHSYAMTSPAMAQMAMYRGGMGYPGMGYPGMG